MRRISYSLFVVILLSSGSARAARVYQFVDYPSLQEGHTLSGMITTTDDAPEDSILGTDEILSWEWSITGPFEPGGFTATSDDYEFDFTVATGVTISMEAIAMPLSNSGIGEQPNLVLSRSMPGGRGTISHSLGWDTNFATDVGATRYFASQFLGDFIKGYWAKPSVGLGNSHWVIATAIPEPSSLLVVMSMLVPLAIYRRRAIA